MKDYNPLEEQELDSSANTRRDQELEDLRYVMNDKRGRRVLFKLLDRTGVYRNPFTGNSETFFKCGEMNIGQYLIAEMQALGGSSYADLLKEDLTNGN
tara:strand:- start:6194 stop:6487 length:294 start_codon:yes stop_codon:yes gene_type:complete